MEIRLEETENQARQKDGRKQEAGWGWARQYLIVHFEDLGLHLKGSGKSLKNS